MPIGYTFQSVQGHYWSNPPFAIHAITPLGQSGAPDWAPVPEFQKN